MSIYKKILDVQKAVETIPKKGYNAFNKYHYATEADVLSVKKIFNEHGLIAFPSVERFETLHRGESVQTLLHIKYTVVDVESGETLEVYVLGQGEDKGDKGAYKAATGGNKYFYLKFAGVETGDDPERDEASKEQGKKPPYSAKGYSGSPKQTTSQSMPTGHNPPIQAGGADYKALIKDLVATGKTTWKTVSDVTGIQSVLQESDQNKLKTGYENLLVHLAHAG